MCRSSLEGDVFEVFLGSYAMLGDQTSEPNPYVVFVTCLVGAVFSEDIWNWAREKFIPKKEDEEEAAKAKKPVEAKREQPQNPMAAVGAPQAVKGAWSQYAP